MRPHAPVLISPLLLLCACPGGPAATSGDMGAPADLAKIVDLAVAPGDMLALANTGEPCAKPTDCAKGLGPSQNPQCLRQTGQAPNTITWPDGYCTTPCRQMRNDANQMGINPDCPGGNATCDSNNLCRQICQNRMDCRAGYGCFVVNRVAPYGCQALGLSQCDPGLRGSCVSDGGAPFPDLGGQPDGAMIDYPPTCVNVGDGTVGNCVPGCEPVGNAGCPGSNGRTDCHASTRTGEGLCTGPGAAGAPGAMCGNFFDDCAGGLGCLSSKCQKYCREDGKTVAQQCGVMGATCKKLNNSTTVPTTVVGLCSSSL